MTEPPVTDATSPQVHRSYLKRRLAVNTGAAVVTNLWAIVVSVAVVPVLLAGLGAEQFGVWAVLLTFSAVTGWFSLADVGVSVSASNSIAAAHAAGDRDAVARIASSTSWFFVLVAAIGSVAFAAVGVLALAVSGLGDDHPRWHLGTVVVWFGVQIGADTVARSATTILDGVQRVDLARLLDAIRRTAVAAAAAGAATVNGTLRSVAVAAAGASAASAALAVAVGRRAAGVRLGRWSAVETGRLVRAGAPIAVLRPLGVIHRTMDRLIVAAVIGPVGVAAVEVAASLQNGADAVLSASSYSVTPTAAYLEGRGDDGGLRALLVRATKASLLATLPVATFAIALGGPIVEVWLGDDAPDDAGVLVALAGSAIAVVSLAAVASNLLVGIGRSSAVLHAAIGSIIINLGSSVWLANEIGTRGVFVGTILGSLYVAPALVRAATRATGTPIAELARGAVARGVAPSVALAAVLAAVVLVVDGAWARLLVGVTIGGPVALAATVGYGLSPPERAALRRRLRRPPTADRGR